MRTRNQIYNGEGALLLRIISTYHTLRYDQIMQLFCKNKDSMKALITKMVKQGRIYHDKDLDLLCDTPESAVSPDYSVMAAFWVLLDFKKAVIYHTSGDFPIKLHFFSQDEAYEIIYVGIGQEALVNHVMQNFPPKDALRLVILDSKEQASKVSIQGVIAFCIVEPSGTVSYYKK